METGRVPGLDDGDAQNSDGDPWQDGQSIRKLRADADDLQQQLSHAERKARDADPELDEYKHRVARALGDLARDLINIDPDLGDFVLDAMRELDD